MAPPPPTAEERAARIRACFQQWDKDGKGYITKRDMKAVLKMLVPAGETVTSDEIDQLMLEADRNGNGRIEYHEFVTWLTRPASSVHAGAKDIAFFDLEELLRPLYEIYDRNGDGSISVQEFAECHNILQTALTLHPAQGQMPDPEVVSADSAKVFRKADGDHDQRVTFEEFVTWQRGALERSGLLNDDLIDLIPALTRQLMRVFKLADSNEKGGLMSNDQNVLMHITKNVAMFTRDLYNADEACHSSLRGRKHYENRWSDPPIGLNLERLKGLHLSTVAVAVWGVDDTEFVTMCVPEMNVRDGAHRRWLARIVRRVTYRTGRTEVDYPHYYCYDNLNWTHYQGLEDEYNKAHEALPPELRIFCHIKSAANFGLQISWEQLQAAFAECVANELLTDLQVALYNAHVEGAVVKGVRESGLAQMSSREELERLRSMTKQAPRCVMASLAELGVLKVSSVWADVLKA